MPSLGITCFSLPVCVCVRERESAYVGQVGRYNDDDKVMDSSVNAQSWHHLFLSTCSCRQFALLVIQLTYHRNAHDDHDDNAAAAAADDDDEMMMTK